MASGPGARPYLVNRMRPSAFIAGHLRFKGKMAVVSMTVSFLVIALAFAVSGGFRTAIRAGISEVSGDVVLSDARRGGVLSEEPVRIRPELLDALQAVGGVRGLTPAVYRPGIVQCGDRIHGVLFKGVPVSDTAALGVRIPERLSERLGLKPGDDMLAYFVGERVQARRFHVRECYRSPVETDANLLVYASLEDMRRLAGWDGTECSTLELTLDPSLRSPEALRAKTAEIGALAASLERGEDPVLVASSSVDRYPNLFEWMGLIDFNVWIVLLLMILVAGFNMVSALLILLFRNISTIGTLKALGMTDRGIAGVFLRVSARMVLTGMAAGNALALAFCLLQHHTRLIRLNPANYFVSYVPVHVDVPLLLLVNLLSFAVIMLILLLPSLFVARVDPAETVRVK